MSDDGKVAAVTEALKQRGVIFVGLASDGWLKFRGPLQAQGTTHDCGIELDPKFFELPRIQLLKLPLGLSRVTPHLGTDGHLCYIAKGTVVLDIFDPVGQTLACIRRAEEVLEKVLNGEMVEDLEEEFYAYWSGPLCLVDMQDQRLGRQETLVIKPGDTFTAVVTDDATRTTKKLKALGWEVTDYTVRAYRVRTSAKPRPHTSAWPPKTVREVLSWQGLLDPRCRKKIEKRLLEALGTTANGALILIESPLTTYGFTVTFKRKAAERGIRRSPRASMYSLDVMPMSVVRIDDRYMAQRNVPGQQTLAGKRLVLVGCGTIGGYLAEMLVKAGAGTSGGQLTLVDFDSLYPQNIGRHRLGFPHLFSNKAIALGEELQRNAPGADVRALPADVKRVQLGKVDLLIDATGEEGLGHWLCERYLPSAPMLSTWIEGPGTAVRSLLRLSKEGACFRCLCDANRNGMFTTLVGDVPKVMAGQGCEGLYVPFPASVSLQAASLAAEMVLAWANGARTPALRTKLIDSARELATPDCDPPRREDCPACPS
jgi:hypothetical protein